MTKKLGGGRVKPADFTIPRLHASVPAGTTLANVLLPDFWQNYSTSIQVGTEICVLSEDFSLDVRLRLLSIDSLRAKMRVLDVYEAPDVESADIDADQSVDGIEIKWRGPNGKWSIIKDGDVLEDKISSKEVAQERMGELAAG